MNIFADHPCELCGETFLAEEDAAACQARCADKSSRLKKEAAAKLLAPVLSQEQPAEKAARAPAKKHTCRTCKRTHESKKRASACEHYPW